MGVNFSAPLDKAKLPALSVPAKREPDAGVSRELVKAMAMDAGKNLCAYLEVMYPQVWHGQNSGFKISMKHHVYNDIMALADLHDETAIRKRLADNEAHRKEWVGMYRKMRRKKRGKSEKSASFWRGGIAAPNK